MSYIDSHSGFTYISRFGLGFSGASADLSSPVLISWADLLVELGSIAVEAFDADNAASIVTSGGVVTGAVGTINGWTANSVAGSPAFSSTGLVSGTGLVSHAGFALDGVDDCITWNSAAYPAWMPVGAEIGWIIALVKFGTVNSGSGRFLFSLGGTSGATGRQLGVIQSGGNIKMRISKGGGTPLDDTVTSLNNTTAIMCAKWDSSLMYGRLNGATTTPASSASATATPTSGLARIGAGAAASAANFGQCTAFNKLLFLAGDPTTDQLNLIEGCLDAIQQGLV